MATFAEGFIEMLGQEAAIFTRKIGTDLVDGITVDKWGDPVEIPPIFKPAKRILSTTTGAEIVTPATFTLGPDVVPGIGDKVAFSGDTYRIEFVEPIYWFGGELSGYRCEVSQEGGVPKP